MASTSLQEIEYDKALLCQHYEMTNLGDLSWIPRMHITHDWTDGWVSLLQEKYSTKILKCFRKFTIHTISTPALVNEHLHKLSKSEFNPKPYQSAVRALIYPMLGIQPDLVYIVAALRQHNTTPGTVHFQSLDHVFRYLCKSSNLHLVFQCGMPNGTILCDFINADWASNINDQKLTSSFVFMLGGGAISWRSKKQGSVMLLSTEAEYIAITYATKEAIWLQCLLGKLSIDTSFSTTLHIDN
jgi:hypothetical protein